MGVIIRDDKGLVVPALSKKIGASLGASEVEANAFEVGLHFAKDVGIHSLILEGSSLIIYRGLAGISPSPTSVMGLGQLVMSSAVLFFLCTYTCKAIYQLTF